MVFGFDLSLTSGGLSLEVRDEALYSAVPAVVDGRFELTDIQTIDSAFSTILMTEDDFERVIEGSLNDAFAAHDLMPTGLSLRDAEMIVNVSQ